MFDGSIFILIMSYCFLLEPSFCSLIKFKEFFFNGIAWI